MSAPLSNPCIYQSPAVCYDRVNKTLLIFAECKSSVFEPVSQLVMKRGILLEKTPGVISTKWNRMTMIQEAYQPGDLSLNPCPVIDEKKHKLFLFFTCVEGSYTEKWQIDNGCNKTRLCYVSSEDLGDNWSEVTDLTRCLPEHCITFSVGPGHGLQTEDGRLIVPAYVYIDKEGSDGKPVPHAVSLFSDDGGESWQFGCMIPEKSTSCQMAEVWVDDGRFIYCNANDQRGHRLEAFSDDNGDTFTVSGVGKLANTLPGCQGSVVSFPAQNTAAEQDASPTPNRWLLVSHPVGTPDKLDLAVFLNKTPSDPKAWSKPWVFKKGVSRRSDLVYIDNGYFACVFEEHMNHITYRRFHFSEINLECSKCSIL